MNSNCIKTLKQPSFHGPCCKNTPDIYKSSVRQIGLFSPKAVGTVNNNL